MTDLTEIVPAADYARMHGEAKKKSRNEKLHADFAHACRVRRLPDPLWKKGPGGELRFAKGHKEIRRLKPKKTDRAPAWGFDFAWPEFKVAVEIQGLVMREAILKNSGESRWVCVGGHASPTGYKNDCEKINAAQELGWIVLQFEQDMLKAGMAIDTTVRVLHARGWRLGAKPNSTVIVGTFTEHSEPGLTLASSKSSAPASRKGSVRKPSTRASASRADVTPVSVAIVPQAAPVLSPAVQEIAESYPPGKHDWSRVEQLAAEFDETGIAKLVSAATQYRRQLAGQAVANRHAGIPSPMPMAPDKFFGTDAWHGPFDIIVDPRVVDAERETALSNEEWLRSKYASAK